MRAAALGIFLFITLSASAIGGSIGYQNIHTYMDWEPDCYKPSPPTFFVSDIHSYNMAVDEYNSFVSELQTYLSCIQSEGESDLKTLAVSISNSIDEKRSEAMSELQSAKSDLSMQKLMLQ